MSLCCLRGQLPLPATTWPARRRLARLAKMDGVLQALARGGECQRPTPQAHLCNSCLRLARGIPAAPLSTLFPAVPSSPRLPTADARARATALGELLDDLQSDRPRLDVRPHLHALVPALAACTVDSALKVASGALEAVAALAEAVSCGGAWTKSDLAAAHSGRRAPDVTSLRTFAFPSSFSPVFCSWATP